MATRFTLLPFFLAAAFLVPPAAGRAQTGDAEAQQVRAGDLIRMRWIGSGVPSTGFQWSGRFLAVQDSTFSALSDRGDTMSVPRAAIRRIEVRTGPRSPLAGLGRGFASGALVGGVLLGSLWAIGCSGTRGDEGSMVCPQSRIAAFGLGFTLGAPPAGLLGGMIGALSPGDRWREAALPPPAPSPAAPH